MSAAVPFPEEAQPAWTLTRRDWLRLPPAEQRSALPSSVAYEAADPNLHPLAIMQALCEGQEVPVVVLASYDPSWATCWQQARLLGQVQAKFPPRWLRPLEARDLRLLKREFPYPLPVDWLPADVVQRALIIELCMRLHMDPRIQPGLLPGHLIGILTQKLREAPAPTGAYHPAVIDWAMDAVARTIMELS